MSKRQARNLPDRPKVRNPSNDALAGMGVAQFIGDWFQAHPEMRPDFWDVMAGKVKLPPLFKITRFPVRQLVPCQHHTRLNGWKPGGWVFVREGLENALLAAHSAPEPDQPKPPKQQVPVKVISLVPFILDAAMWRDEATKQTREAAHALVALYERRYSWQTGIITPKQTLRRAA